MMTEDETRAELIDPKLRESGWGGEGTKVFRNHAITQGRIQVGGRRANLILLPFSRRIEDEQVI